MCKHSIALLLWQLPPPPRAHEPVFMDLTQSSPPSQVSVNPDQGCSGLTHAEKSERAGHTSSREEAFAQSGG